MREAVFSFNSARAEQMTAASAATGAADPAVFGVNALSDLTETEFVALFTGAREDGSEPADQANENAFGGRGLQSSYPSSVNWATTGKVGAVKNQGPCGSCWAFNTSTILEAMISIQNSTAPVRLSEQELVDCARKRVRGVKGSYNCSGCNGGWMAEAWRYVKYNG